MGSSSSSESETTKPDSVEVSLVAAFASVVGCSVDSGSSSAVSSASTTGSVAVFLVVAFFAAAFLGAVAFAVAAFVFVAAADVFVAEGDFVVALAVGDLTAVVLAALAYARARAFDVVQ